MIKAFLVYNENDDAIAIFYTEEEAIRFILVCGQAQKQNTSEWTYIESVLGNNADKLAAAMFG